MRLFIAKQCTKLSFNSIFHVGGKINNGRMSELQKRKIHICSECNKEIEDIRRSYNKAKCCCSCELRTCHLHANVSNEKSNESNLSICNCIDTWNI